MACNVRKKPRSSINVLARRGSRRTMHSWCACAEAKERILQGTGRVQLQDCLKKGRRPGFYRERDVSNFRTVSKKGADQGFHCAQTGNIGNISTLGRLPIPPFEPAA